jgi:hypothetical protein
MQQCRRTLTKKTGRRERSSFELPFSFSKSSKAKKNFANPVDKPHTCDPWSEIFARMKDFVLQQSTGFRGRAKVELSAGNCDGPVRQPNLRGILRFRFGTKVFFDVLDEVFQADGFGQKQRAAAA